MPQGEMYMPQLPIKPIALLLLVALLLVCFRGSSPAEPAAAFSETPPTVGTSAAPVTSQTATTQAVTTAAPTSTASSPTVPPTTVAGEIIPPVTVPPTTVPPTTVPPTTIPPTTAAPTTVPDPIDAQRAFIYHCGSGEYSYIRGDLNAIQYPASLTKLMSIYVGLMYLQPEQLVTVGDIVNTVPSDSSLAYLVPGDQLTVKDLMAALLLPSGNDAAQVWAVEAGRAAAGDPSMTQWAAREYFMGEMNRQAALLGLTNSHFVTPDGYDADGHYSSVADLCKIAQLCLENPLILSITSMAKYTVTLSGREVTWSNTNLMLQTGWPSYYRENVIGLKTGSTSAAGNCVIAVFREADELVIIGVFGSSSYTTRFEAVLALYDEYL